MCLPFTYGAKLTVYIYIGLKFISLNIKIVLGVKKWIYGFIGFP